MISSTAALSDYDRHTADYILDSGIGSSHHAVIVLLYNVLPPFVAGMMLAYLLDPTGLRGSLRPF
jgi:ABC-type molybdate transport system permease subunit